MMLVAPAQNHLTSKQKSLLAILPDSRRVALGLLIFVIPLNIDENFIVFPSPGGADGLTFGLVEIFMLVLLGITLTRHVQSNQIGALQFFPALLLPSLTILGFYFISMIYAQHLLWSLFDTFNFAKAILLYWIVANNIQRERDLRVVLVAFFAGILVQSILTTAINVNPALADALFRYKFGIAPPATNISADVTMRSGGSLGNTNHLGRYFGLLLPIAFTIFLTHRKNRLKNFAGCVALFGTVSLVNTLSRSAWAGFVFSLLIMAPLMLKYRLVSYRTLWLISFAGICLASFLFFSADILWTRLTGDDQGAAMTRITTAKVAWEIIKDYPFFGCGINNYGAMLSDYWIGEDTFTNRAAVHNNYLLYMAEIGIIGFAAIIWWLVAFARRITAAIKSKSRFYQAVAIGIMGGYSGMLLTSLTDKSYKENFSLLLTLWVLMAMTEAIIRMDRKLENNQTVTVF